MKDLTIYKVLSKNNYVDLDGDRIEEKKVWAFGHQYTIEKREFGAIDENGEEVIPYGGRVTVQAVDTEDEAAIEAIYNFFDDGDYELYLDREVIYNTFPTTRPYINITTWKDDEDLERAYARVHYCMVKLDELIGKEKSYEV